MSTGTRELVVLQESPFKSLAAYSPLALQAEQAEPKTGLSEERTPSGTKTVRENTS